MEIKKNPRASLEDKRLLLAEVGLILALLAVYAGFESSTRAQEVAYLTDTTQVAEEDDIIPVVLDTPPPAPEVPALPTISDILDIVDDDVVVDLEFQNLENTDVPVDIREYIHQEVVQEEVEDEIIPIINVQQKPTFLGKDANSFATWVNPKIVYPEIARENGVQGRVVLQLTIWTDGSVRDVKVLSSPDETLSREAVRVVSSSPKWEPGRQRDRAVKVSFTFPVIFRLQ